MLVIALLVVAALPASASDSQQDACDGLLNALDVLENRKQVNERAIDNLTSRADAAGCIDFPESRDACTSVGGTFTTDPDAVVPGYFAPLFPIWTCEDWEYGDEADFWFILDPEGPLASACKDDVTDYAPATAAIAISKAPASATCYVNPS